MLDLKKAVLIFASCSLLMAKADTASTPVGNEKTVGASSQTTSVPRVEDSNTVGNAKTVGGDPDKASENVAYRVDTSQPAESGVGKVGNSKTVGGN